MEKLLRDLNIYAHSFMNCNLTFTYDGNRIRVQGDEIGPYVSESIILNKKFGFIKRLVENDKIDRPRVWLKIKDLGKDYGWFAIYSGIHIECLLMLLSISDTPIEDLISYLN